MPASGSCKLRSTSRAERLQRRHVQHAHAFLTRPDSIRALTFRQAHTLRGAGRGECGVRNIRPGGAVLRQTRRVFTLRTWPAVLGSLLLHEPVDGEQERGQGLTRTCGRNHQHVLARFDGLPRALLHGRGRGERVQEPGAHCRRERAQPCGPHVGRTVHAVYVGLLAGIRGTRARPCGPHTVLFRFAFHLRRILSPTILSGHLTMPARASPPRPVKRFGQDSQSICFSSRPASLTIKHDERGSG